MHDIHGGYIPIHIRHKVDFLKHSFFVITKLLCSIVTFDMRYSTRTQATRSSIYTGDFAYESANNSVYDFMHKVVCNNFSLLIFPLLRLLGVRLLTK
jgi:hypothetical protein